MGNAKTNESSRGGVNVEKREFEVAVIGAGPGGYVAAIRLAQLGKKVAIIDRDAIGGVCLNYGCIPSKALISVGTLYEKMQSASEFGIHVKGLSLDFSKVQEWKRSVVEKLTSGVNTLLKKNGAQVIRGEARFLSPTELEITSDEGKEKLKAQSIIVATGSRPMEIPGFAIDEEDVISAKGALELEEVPHRLLVIGGGVIGLEIGTFYAKLGARVIVVELLPNLLPGTPAELTRIVERVLKKKGVEIHLKSTAHSYDRTGKGLVVKAQTEGKEFDLEADKILLSVGVRPNSEGLALEAAGVEVDKRGHIVVDHRLQTNVPSVYAIGDVTPGPYLAHRASKEGIVAAEAISGLSTVIDYKAFPAAIFTDPEVATVGMSEQEAKDSKREVKVGRFPFAASGRALASGETEGFVKLVADASDNTLLGAQIVGPEASNLIAEAALAIEMGATVEDLALTVHAHPTLPETLMEAAEFALGHAIHVMQKR